MRLLSLTAHNFRGFGSSRVTVGLGADLVLMFGPNGFSKTSFAEAIEWFFYGTTRRRKRGETYSKSEYDGCFANVHGGLPVEVSARVPEKFGGPQARHRSPELRRRLSRRRRMSRRFKRFRA